MNERRGRFEMINGYSTSLWKSLVVKALRLGWEPGLRRAGEVLDSGTMQSLLIAGLFEDTFPARGELAAAVSEVKRRDYAALCARETHHRRGYTDEFCAMKAEALEARENQKAKLLAVARKMDLWLPPRCLNCFYTWLALDPQDEGRRRVVDTTPWTGIPIAMADSHTLEGKRAKVHATILSGHYEQHAKLATMVSVLGWEAVRHQVHSEGVYEERPEQNSLF